MDLEELRRRVDEILAAEETQPTDWQAVEFATLELKRDLLEAVDTPPIVDRYLDDVDIRRERGEGAYAKAQRDELRRFIASGEYTRGTTVPVWTCPILPLILTLAVGLIL